MVDHFHRALDWLVPVADQSGVDIWVENMPFAFLPDLDHLLEAVDAHAGPELGICYDVANAHFIDENPAEGIRQLSGRLKLLHISDTCQSTYRHDAIGFGDVDFSNLGEAMSEASFVDPPILEIISSQPDADIQNAGSALRGRGF